MKTYYDLLGVEPAASIDEIKRCFRREIARYHPDKVQHLGQEFQELAAARAAELTQAYRTLMDPQQRAEYDEGLRQGTPASAAASHAPPPAEAPHAAPPEATPPFHEDVPPRPDTTSCDDLVRRATVARFRQAAEAELGAAQPLRIAGFDVAYTLKSKSAFLRRKTGPTRLLARFTSQVDAAAVQETWGLALKAGTEPDGAACVFVMGPGLASAGQLGAAIADQRRRHPRSAAPITLVPLDVRDWDALVPTDAPAVVKGILERLRRSI